MTFIKLLSVGTMGSLPVVTLVVVGIGVGLALVAVGIGAGRIAVADLALVGRTAVVGHIIVVALADRIIVEALADRIVVGALVSHMVTVASFVVDRMVVRASYLVVPSLAAVVGTQSLAVDHLA